MYKFIRNRLKRHGFDVIRYHAHKILLHYQFDLVLDVGANTGQYAEEIRVLGYNGQIVSFEPLKTAFTSLSGKASRDPKWEALNTAIGDYDGEAYINVSANSYSSSLRDVHSSSVEAAPGSRFVDKERVQVRRLDSVMDEITLPEKSTFLKIDTQGYEKQVLEGGRNSIDRYAGLQLEMSLLPVYKEGDLYDEMLDYVKQLGFRLVHVRPGFCHPESGLMFQIDAIFLRKELLD